MQRLAALLLAFALGCQAAIADDARAGRRLGPGDKGAGDGSYGDQTVLYDGRNLPTARIKDIAQLQSSRDNQLVGYGLVIGLNGSGDGLRNSPFTEQSIRAMLLDRTATANAKPELEIYADDVKCAHGCAVGELDAAGLFYLESRGLPPAEAKRLMLQAFIAEAFVGAAEEARLADLALASLEAML